MSVLESKIQSKIIKYLEKKGCIVVKQTITNKNGIPDLLVLVGNGKHFWIECKQDKGIESKIQEYMRKKLAQHGDISIVAYGYDDFLEKISKINLTI